MTERRSGPRNHLVDIVDSFAMEHGGRYIETHPRFNLTKHSEEAIDAVVTEIESGRRERMIVATESDESRKLYDDLNTAGLEQFERHEYQSGIVFYKLPPQVKPLSYERLFLDRTSSDTYVSDSEIFMYLGKLWGAVYRQTGQLPAETPLEQTALRDFVKPEQSLVPIPPYKAWIKVPDEQSAEEYLLECVGREIQDTTGSYTQMEPINESIRHGWRSDGAA